ncbi:MAG: hypothetical protein KAR19_02250 [Bacteroidales bacterium]|nr:hypothetical protein [Bacteroidales bacterium]
MKTIIAFITSLTLLVATVATLHAVKEGNSPSEKESIILLSSPELFDMASSWVNEYTRAYPEAAITVTAVPDDGLKEQLFHAGTIGLVTKRGLSGISSEGPWKMVIGRDVAVPVMNLENPYREEILQSGISPEAFSMVYTASDKPTWGMLLGNSITAQVTPYSIGGKSTVSYLAAFLEVDQIQMKGNETTGIGEMLDQIRKDRLAIGFCTLTDICDEEGREIESGISLIPVDMDGNGRIDPFEDIYHNGADLERGIWLGKYPAALYSRLYMVAGERPTSNDELAFLEWMVTDGQQYLSANGFSGLNSSEKYSTIEHLKGSNLIVVDIPVRATTTKIFLLVFGVILAGVVILILVISVSGTRVEEAGTEGLRRSSVFGKNSATFPEGLFFDKSHTWIFMEKDGNVRIGIDDFLQHVTGPITRINMKKPGDSIKKGEPFLTLIQQGKRLEIQSPVTGIVREQNNGLVTDSGIINAAPFSDGWVYVVEPGNWLKEIQAYAMGDKYRNWLKTEFSRLKDFLSSGIRYQGAVEAVLQDGGEMKAGVLESFGPEVWEEFQTGFINSSR